MSPLEHGPVAGFAALLLALSISVVPAARAAPPESGEIYPFFRGVRALGMGGAGVATVNDETALFLNPAGLGKIRGPIVNVADLELESNGDSYTAFRIADGRDLKDPQSLLDVMQDDRLRESHLHARLQVFPSIVTTNFGFGVFGKYQLDAEMEQGAAVAPSYMRTNYVNDLGATMGYCLRLLDGRLKIGAAGKILNRVQVSEDIPTGSTGLTFGGIAREGGGAGVDAGVLLTAPWIFLPTLGVTVTDLGDTEFNLGGGLFHKTGRVPDPQRQSVNVAVALFPIHSNKVRSSWTIEYTDVQNPEGKDVWRRLHAGLEINVSDVLFLRAGLNQRYWTAGLELATNLLQIQFATYGEEIGSPTRNREDRRYVGKIGFRF